MTILVSKEIGWYHDEKTNIWAAWAVDREFVNILELTGEVSHLFWLDFELLWLSGVCSGLYIDSLRRI